jgi:hypothetical protein
MPDLHSKLSPSSASRWLACPASLEGGPYADQTNCYAAEGTVAHALANRCWLLGAPPEMFLGQPHSCEGHTVVINQEMVDAVKVYLCFIESLADGGRVLTETRIESGLIQGFGGTIDCMLPDKMHLVDFKYGAGLPVDVRGNGEGTWEGVNVQMACYAILAREHLNKQGDVTVTVVQPRASHPDGPIRTTTLEGDYLADLTLQLLRVADGDRANEIHAGDHCRWCPRKVYCPELYEITLLTAKKEFAEVEMTPETAAKFLDQSAAIKTFLDGVESWVHGRLEKGIDVPGYKLVDRYGHRRYSADEAKIVRFCRNKGFGKKQIYQTELLSPAQLEKVVGKELITSLVERPHLGTTVVPASDRRQAVKRLTAAEEFANSPEDLETEK